MSKEPHLIQANLIDLKSFIYSCFIVLFNWKPITRIISSRYFTGSVAAHLPPAGKKDTYTVGFAQTGSNNPWRLAETKSMKDEADKRGYTLVQTDANEDTAKQIADVDSLIAQGVDILIFPPRESQALAPSERRPRPPVFRYPDRPRRRSLHRQTGRGLRRICRFGLRRSRTASR